MFITLAEAKDSSLRNISGVCPTSDEFVRLLNDATRILMRRGDWKGIVTPIYVCLKRGCVVWPRWVGQVRKLNWCNHPLPIKGLWWEFMEYDTYRHWCGPHFPNHRMVNQGYSPVHTDILGTGRIVRAYPDAQYDVGKTVTIFGLDDNQQPLRTKQVDGTFTEGVVITLAAPFGSTNTFVSRIDRVLKDETTGYVRLYAYDATNDVLEDLAIYEPGETNPQYVRHNLRVPCCGGDTCQTARSVVALVKLQYIPAKADTDLVLIQNLDALKDMMQSIKAKESNSLDLAKELEVSSIRELNLELADQTPDDQIPIAIEPFQGRAFHNACY